MNAEEILENIIKVADKLNFGVGTNALKIAKLKSRMDDWKCCPCDKNNPDRFCGSDLCRKDTIRDGWCQCHCMFKLDNIVKPLRKKNKERTKKKKERTLRSLKKETTLVNRKSLFLQ